MACTASLQKLQTSKAHQAFSIVKNISLKRSTLARGLRGIHEWMHHSLLSFFPFNPKKSAPTIKLIETRIIVHMSKYICKEYLSKNSHGLDDISFSISTSSSSQGPFSSSVALCMAFARFTVCTSRSVT